MLRTVAAVAIAVFAAGVPATAQEAKAGISMGYPSSVGLLWHVSNRVALRPDFSVTRTTSESGVPGVDLMSDVSGWTYGVGVSLLWYFPIQENLRTYVTPRIAYARGSSMTTTSPPSGAPITGKTVVDGWQVSGSFGAQYWLKPRFAVFGEAGVQYADNESVFSSRSSVSGTTTSNTWGSRTAVGVVLYFH